MFFYRLMRFFFGPITFIYPTISIKLKGPYAFAIIMPFPILLFLPSSSTKKNFTFWLKPRRFKVKSEIGF